MRHISKKRRVWLLVLCFVTVCVFQVFFSAFADALPITISIQFDKQTVKAGETITASYEIAGGTGNYTYLDFSWQAEKGYCGYGPFKIQGSENGSGVTSIKTIHDGVYYITVTVQDEEGRVKSYTSESVAVTDGINITVAYDKYWVDFGDSIDLTYTITGGSGEYSVTTGFSVIFDNPSYHSYETNIKHSTCSKETITYTPQDGESFDFYVSVEDSNGVKEYYNVGSLSVIYIHYCTDYEIIHEEWPASCLDTGFERFKCSKCGSILSPYITIPALGHDIVHHDGKAATCTEAGYKEYDACSRCSYTTYTKIAALGHKWKDPTYTWSKDKNTVKAKRVCTRDRTHIDTETVETTLKVTKKPTYTSTGSGTYITKAFKNTVFKKQTKKVIIDKLPQTSITKAKVTAIGDQVYTGSAIKPALTVKYSGKKLVKGTDYTVSFKDNVKPGKATVTITGKNAYKGKTTVSFKILPKAVKLVSVRPGKAKITVIWKKGAGVDGYEIQYSTKKDFSTYKTVKVAGVATLKTKIPNLKPGKTYYVRIRAYKKAGSKMYYSDWSAKMEATVPDE